jgi:hypothetical protein
MRPERQLGAHDSAWMAERMSVQIIRQFWSCGGLARRQRPRRGLCRAALRRAATDDDRFLQAWPTSSLGLLMLEVTDKRDRQIRIDQTESQPGCAQQRIR